jgi:cysteine synthase
MQLNHEADEAEAEVVEEVVVVVVVAGSGGGGSASVVTTVLRARGRSRLCRARPPLPPRPLPPIK